MSEIHLFDGDQYKQHNAFRAPGPTSISGAREEAEQGSTVSGKVRKDERRGLSHMRSDVDVENVDTCLVAWTSYSSPSTAMKSRQWLLPALERLEVPFVDVGMGIEKVEDKLLGDSEDELRGDAQEFGGAARCEVRLRDVGRVREKRAASGVECAECGACRDSVEEAPRILFGPRTGGQEHLHY